MLFNCKFLSKIIYNLTYSMIQQIISQIHNIIRQQIKLDKTKDSHKKMNRSIAKTRNQLERITLKINQLKTKYTGDIYNQNLNSGVQNSSPISQSQGQSQGQTQGLYSHQVSQFKDYPENKIKERERDTRQRESLPVGFQNKHVSVGMTGNNKSSLSLQTQGDEMYQKQFKIFRNEIYNYIDKCISVTKDKQQQIIDKCLHSFSQKQKQQLKKNPHKQKVSSSNLEQRIKKIQEQTTTCITNIQDAIVQIKKNQKYFNDKISNGETKTKKDILLMSEQVKKLANDKSIACNQELLAKTLALEKVVIGLKEELNKQSRKISSFDQSIQQITIKIQNSQNRIQKKVNQLLSCQQQSWKSKQEIQSDQLERYHKFNIMIEKQILELGGKVDQLGKKIWQEKVEREKQLQEVKQQIDEEDLIEKVKETVFAQFEQRINGIQETLQKNCGDLASVAQSVLSIESRVQQILASQVTLRQIIEIHQQKVSDSQSKIKNTQKILSQKIQQQMQNQKSTLFQQLSTSLTSYLSNQTSKLSTIIQQSLHQSLEKSLQYSLRQKDANNSQLITTKLSQQIEILKQQLSLSNEANIFEKINKLLNVHEQRIMQKISDYQDRSRSMEQIVDEQSMRQEMLGKVKQQVQDKVVELLAIYQQKRECKSDQYITSATFQHNLLLMQQKLKTAFSNQINISMKLNLQKFNQELKQSGQIKSKTQNIEYQQFVQKRLELLIDQKVQNLKETIKEVQATIIVMLREEVKVKINEIRAQIQPKITFKLQELKNSIKSQVISSIEIQSHSEQPSSVQLQQHLSNIQYTLKQYLQTLVEQKLEEQPNRALTRVQTLDSDLASHTHTYTQNKQSPQSKESQEHISQAGILVNADQQVSAKRVLQIVQEKLNQFETDINETIKLLYQDIQNKVNEMLGHTGMMDFRADYEDTKRKIAQFQQKIQQNFLMLIQTNNIVKTSLSAPTGNKYIPQPPSPIATIQQPQQAVVDNNQQFQVLKTQIFTQVANQIEKISLILERTLQQMEMKVQKLDHNFSYVYERVSNIEFDNASFKDKLTYLLAEREKIIRSSPAVEYRRATPQKKQALSGFTTFTNVSHNLVGTTTTNTTSNNLLDVLGKFSTTGTAFFQTD